MAIKELFYDQRPVLGLSLGASGRLDPRLKFARASAATYTSIDGYVQKVGQNTPRFDYDPQTGERYGLSLEKSATNLVVYSEDFTLNRSATGYGTKASVTADATTAPDKTTTADLITTVTTTTQNRLAHSFVATSGLTYSYSVYIKKGNLDTVEFQLGYLNRISASCSFTFSTETFKPAGDTLTSSWAHKLSDGWYRISISGKAFSSGVTYAGFIAGTTAGDTVYVWGEQIEEQANTSSYIPTNGAQATRSAELLSIDSLRLPAAGSVYVDSRSITTDINSTLLSLKNASNQKLNLAMEQRSELYNSLALTYSIKGTVKPTLPYPVPTTNRERNIITWGTNNYQYNTDGARYAPSLSTTPGIPANLTQLSIGHDAVDPTKAFNGYINAVYLYNGEISPTVAEALVRGELNPINADTYSPVGPTGSLALIINTQGATSSGDKVFALPAESALNDNDIVITWGDGTESGLDGAAAELGAAGLSHTYPSAGIYPVWVEGQLENLQFNNSASAPDLVKIQAWGTTANGNDVFLSPSTMNSAFYGCSKLTSVPTSGLPDTSAVTDWTAAFQGCSSLTGTFPSFNFSAATTFSRAFFGCSGLTAFTAAGDQTQNVTNFYQAWYDCSGLTSFPLINTSSATSLSYAWYNCSSLTSIFPTINTANVTNFEGAWYNCSGFTEFPLLNTSSGTNMNSTWRGCTGLASFPLLNTSSITNFFGAWYGCSSLNNIGVVPGATTSFPLINTSSGTNFAYAWYGCSSLEIFPLIDTSSGIYFDYAWRDCSSLTSFPSINTSLCTDFTAAWYGCSSLNNIGVVPGAATSFPTIDTSSGATFGFTWYGCSSLEIFPLIDISSGIYFGHAWRNCSSLTSFPANFFNSWSPTSVFNECFYQTWDGCSSLTPASVVNILDSIAASGQSAPSGTGTNDKKITIDWDGTGDPATDAAAAITTLKSRNWQIYLNDVLQ